MKYKRKQARLRARQAAPSPQATEVRGILRLFNWMHIGRRCGRR